MKSVLVLIICAFPLPWGMTTDNNRKEISENVESENSSEDFLFSLLPLKIILEHKLRTHHEAQDVPVESKTAYKNHRTTSESDSKKDNLKFSPEMNYSSEYVCNNISSFNGVSAEEISKFFSSDFDTDQHSLSVEQLQKIYDSLKNCYFVRVRNAKLWGPLWHCLNRLFLYFVFH